MLPRLRGQKLATSRVYELHTHFGESYERSTQGETTGCETTNEDGRLPRRVPSLSHRWRATIEATPKSPSAASFSLETRKSGPKEQTAGGEDRWKRHAPTAQRITSLAPSLSASEERAPETAYSFRLSRSFLAHAAYKPVCRRNFIQAFKKRVWS